MPEVVRSYVVNVLDNGELVWREVIDGEPVVPRNITHVASMFQQGAEYFQRLMLANAIAAALRPPQQMVIPKDGPRLHI